MKTAAPRNRAAKNYSNAHANWAPSPVWDANQLEHPLHHEQPVQQALGELEQRQPTYLPCPDCGRETCWIGAKTTNVWNYRHSVRPDWTFTPRLDPPARIELEFKDARTRWRFARPRLGRFSKIGVDYGQWSEWSVFPGAQGVQP